MALLDNTKDILTISSIADLLTAKVRTLKMYEEKSLFPKKNGIYKKLYSINDVKTIAFVHYLASVKKINANGIRFILDMIENNMDENSRNNFINEIEAKMEQLSGKDIEDIDKI